MSLIKLYALSSICDAQIGFVSSDENNWGAAQRGPVRWRFHQMKTARPPGYPPYSIPPYSWPELRRRVGGGDRPGAYERLRGK